MQKRESPGALPLQSLCDLTAITLAFWPLNPGGQLERMCYFPELQGSQEPGESSKRAGPGRLCMLEVLWWPKRGQGSSLWDCSLSRQRSVWNMVCPE